MAFALLDGTNGNVDLGITLSGTTVTSTKTIFGYMTIRIGVEMSAQDVFATGAWRKRLKTNFQAVGRLEGFVSQGSPVSDPLSLVGSAGALPVTATYTTGCTLAFSAQFNGDANEVRATANSGRGVDFESWGTVTSVWVIA